MYAHTHAHTHTHTCYTLIIIHGCTHTTNRWADRCKSSLTVWDFYVLRPPRLQQGQKEEKRKKKVHNVSLINQQRLLWVKTKNEDVPTLLGKDRRLEAEAMREWFSFFTKSSIRNCSCSVSIWTSWARWQQTHGTVWGCTLLTCWMYSTAMDVTMKSLFCQNWKHAHWSGPVVSHSKPDGFTGGAKSSR